MTDYYRIDTRLSPSQQMKYLNEMVLKLAGELAQAKFDKNEVTALYTDLGSTYTRKFLRDQGVGNTLATYSNWTHYKAESGYSIWKIQPTNYAYDANNLFCINKKEILNQGSASALATQFDYVFTYDDASGGSYTDVTTDISTEGSAEVAVLADVGDYIYIGAAAKFSGIKFEFKERGSNYTLKVEYYDSTSGVEWTELDDGDSLEDTTLNFKSDGSITFTAPDTWGTTVVNSQTKYWIRISTTTAPVTQAEIYYLTSGESVEGLLALSSSEVLKQTWKFCTYSGYIYVTVPNSGGSDYEGIDYITSSSSATNKQNFFVYNNPITGDYLDSSY